MSELDDILRRALQGPISPEEHRKLRSAMETLGWLQGEISRKDASLGRLRKLLFGTPKTEKTSQVLGESADKTYEREGERSEDPPQETSHAPEPARLPKGHGRNGASAYAGAPRIKIAHETLQPGDPCPPGRMFRQALPAARAQDLGLCPRTRAASGDGLRAGGPPVRLLREGVRGGAPGRGPRL